MDTGAPLSGTAADQSGFAAVGTNHSTNDFRPTELRAALRQSIIACIVHCVHKVIDCLESALSSVDVKSSVE